MMELPEVPFYFRERNSSEIFIAEKDLQDGFLKYSKMFFFHNKRYTPIQSILQAIKATDLIVCDKNGNKIKLEENKMTHDEMIAVIQVKKKGGIIEYNTKGTDEWTRTASNDLFNFSSFNYRIKQEQEMTFSEAIKFIRENPSYEVRIYGSEIHSFSAAWYRESDHMICGSEIAAIVWREEPGKEWKKFVK